MQNRVTQAAQPSLLPSQDWQRKRLTEFKQTDASAIYRELIIEEFAKAFDEFLTAIATKHWEYSGCPQKDVGLKKLKCAAVKGMKDGMERWAANLPYAPERLIARHAFYECRLMSQRLAGPRFLILPSVNGDN